MPVTSPRPAGSALTADSTGAEAFIIAAGDTVMDRPNAELLAECFPSVQLRPGTGDFDTLLSIDKARRVLGYDPAHSWRDIVAGPIGAGAGTADAELDDGHRRRRIDQPVHRLRGVAAPGRPDRRPRHRAGDRPSRPSVSIQGRRACEPPSRSCSDRSETGEEARLEIGVVGRSGGGVAGDARRRRGRRRGRIGRPQRLPFQLTVVEPGWRMFMISHFHYDPVWWNTQAAYTETWGAAIQYRSPFQEPGLALVRSHLEIARRDPDYKFVLAELDYLKPYWDVYPGGPRLRPHSSWPTAGSSSWAAPTTSRTRT